MLDGLVARTGGEGLSVTSVNVKYVYDEIRSVEYLSNGYLAAMPSFDEFLSTEKFPSGINEIRVKLWRPLLQYINIIDTPGFNANESDTEMALKSLDGLDAAVLVINNKSLSKTENEIMWHLTSRQIPFFVIMNCLDNGGDTWNPNSKFNEDKEKVVSDAIKGRGFSPQNIVDGRIVVRANFQWFWYASGLYMQDAEEKRAILKDDIDYYVESHKNKETKAANVNVNPKFSFSDFNKTVKEQKKESKNRVYDFRHFSGIDTYSSYYLGKNRNVIKGNSADDKTLQFISGLGDMKQFTSKSSNKNVGMKNYDKNFFLSNSNILPVRQYFYTDENWGFPVNCIRWKSGFDRIFKSWNVRLENILKDL